MSAGLAWAAASLGALYAGARWFERSHMYHPSRRIEQQPSDVGLEADEVVFSAEDGGLRHGWWIPQARPRGAVLYCHGNGGNIGGRLGLARDLHGLGVSVFLFDYRGYGRSSGLPSERGTYRDARAAFEVVRARYDDADAPPVVAFGASLGGPIAAQLALDRPVRGLILESTFTSAVALGERMFPRLPVRLLCRYTYDTLARVRRVRVPLLVSHSTQDELIPYAMGQELFAAAPGPKRFVTLTGPHDEAGWNHSPAYLRELDAFLTEVLGPRPAPAQ